MRIRIIHTLLPLIFLLLPLFPLLAEEELNAGFIEGLWYSHTPVFAEETVRIYTALRNNTGSDLNAKVVFYDNNLVFATREVSALEGRIVEAWADWDATLGEHTLHAALVDIEVDEPGSQNRFASVTSDLAEDTLIIMLDTDGDRIPDSEDTDDDNDGVSDSDEKEAGTDPLVPNNQNTDDTASDSKVQTNKTNPENTNSTKEGLERYFSDGAIKETLTTVTETINKNKDRLDSYREERNAHIESTRQEKTFEEGEIEENESIDDLIEEAESGTVASSAVHEYEITRSKINPKNEGFLVTVLNLLGRLLSSAYTAVLSIGSLALSIPLFLEIGILLFILYSLYKLARRIGKRPDGY